MTAAWRYIAQRALTNEWLDWDVPLTRDELSWALSGAGSLRGTISPEYARLRGPDGQPILDEWGTYLYAEADGIIRWGGILVSSEFAAGAWSLEAAGFCTYPNGLPWLGEISSTSIDPAVVFRQIWAGVQAQPDGNLGVVVDSTTTPVRLGKAAAGDQPAEPYEFVWWNQPDCGQELGTLSQEGRFDFSEEHSWDGDDVAHRIRIGYPRLGRKRDDLAFIQGDNVIDVVEPERKGDRFANEGIGIGAGEGRAALIRRIPQRDGKLRRPIVYSDVSVTAASRMDTLVRAELSARRQILEVPEITVVNHPHAPIGSWQLGDDILVQAELPWVGDISIWHRVVGWSLAGEATAVLALRRSDSFTYGG